MVLGLYRLLTAAIVGLGLLVAAGLPLRADPTPPVRVAIADNYPPFTILGPDEKPFGLMIDMWRLWSDTTGIPVEFKTYTWADTLEAVKNGDADIHSGLYRNREREAYLDFSRPIHAAGNALYFRSGDPKLPLADLDGRKVGTVAGTFQETYLRQTYPAVRAVIFGDVSVMVESLLRGEIDAVLTETVSLQATLGRLGLGGVFRRSQETLFTNEILAGVAKGRSALLKKINDGFDRISRRRLAEIEGRWLPDPLDHFYSGTFGDINLTREEESWLSNNPVIRLAVTTFINPVDIVDNQGNFTGLNADLMNLLSQKIGVSVVPEFYSRWPDVVANTLDGTVDGAMSFSITPEREKHVLYTKPYAYDPVVIVARDDAEGIRTRSDLAGRQVSVVKGLAWIEEVRSDVGGGELVIVEEEAEALRLLADRKTDAHVSSLILYGNAQKKAFVPGLRVAGSRNTEGGALRIAIHKSKPLLYEIMRKALATLTQDDLGQLRDKWLSPRRPDPEAVLLTAAETEWLRDHPVSRIAVLKNWAPYDITDAHGRHIGLHTDLLRLINKHLGSNIVPLPFDTWKEAYRKAAAGEVEGILGLSWTQEREGTFLFSTPYHYKPADLVMRVGDPPVRDWMALDGRRVWVREKASLIDKVKAELPTATILEAPSEEAALKSLSEGDGDAYMAWISADRSRLDDLNLVVTAQVDDRQGEFTLGVAKSNPTFFSIVQKGINAISQNEWTELRSRWFEQEGGSVFSLTPTLEAWLKDHPVIDIGMMDAWPPISYTDNRGQPRGLSVALVEALNKRLDGALRLRPGAFEANMEAVESGRLPALLDITPKPSREKDFLFTDSYLSIPHVYVARADAPYIAGEEDLAGKTLALEQGFGNVKWFRDNHPGVEILGFADTSAALDAVARGEADAYAGNRAVAMHIIERELMSNLKIHGRVGKKPTVLAVGVRKDWPELRTILQQALASLDEEENREIVRQALAEQADGPLIDLTAEERQWLKDHPVLRIHNETDWPPFNYALGDSPKGYSIDFMQRLANKIGVRVEFVTGPTWAGFLDMIRNKDLDVMLNIIQTPDRDKYIRFTQPYVDNPTVIVARDGDDRIRELKDLNGLSLAIPRGFFYQEIISRKYPGIQLHLVTDQDEALKAVSFGHADASIGGVAVMDYLIRKSFLTNLRFVGSPGDPELENQLRIGVRDDWPVLQGILDKAIGAVTQSERDVLRATWLGRKRIQIDKRVPLDDAERRWLAEHSEVRLGVDSAWPPFDFVGADGTHDGLSADVLELLTQRLGLAFKLQTGLTWQQVLDRAKSRRIDIISVCAETPQRREYLAFSKPISIVPWVIVRRAGDGPVQSLDDLQSERIAVVKGYAVADLIRNKYPDMLLHAVDSPLAGLQEVSDGKIAAYVGNLGVASHLIQKHGLANLRIAANAGFPPQELAICVRSDWPQLVSILNKGLDTISADEMAGIRQKWMPVSIEEVVPAEDESHLSIQLFVALAAGLLLIFALTVYLLSKAKTDRDLSTFFGAAGFRITVLAGLSVLVAVVAMMNWLAISSDRASTEDKINRELQIVLHGTIDRINSWVREQQNFLLQLGRDQTLIQFAQNLVHLETQPEKLALAEEQFAVRILFGDEEQFGEQGFYIVAPNRITIAAPEDADLGRRSRFAEERPEHLDRAFRGEAVLIPPLRLKAEEERTGKPPLAMYFAAPIVDTQGSVLAVLVRRILPRGSLTDVLRFGRLGESGETYAFDADGKMISESRFKSELIDIGLVDPNESQQQQLFLRDPGRRLTKTNRPVTISGDRPLTRMAADALDRRHAGMGHRDHGTEDHTESDHAFDIDGYRDYRGEPVVGAWVWLSEMDVGLTVEMDHAEAYADHHYFRTNLMLISGTATLLAVGATLFTLMLGQRAHRSLSKARDNLEMRVVERTRELQDSETRIRSIIDNAADGIITINEQGIIETFSPAAESMFGHAADEVVGRNIKMLMPGPWRGDHDGYLERYQDTGETRIIGTNREVTGLRKDGSRFPMDLAVGEAHLGDERIFTGIVRDITARKEAEEEIARAEEQNRLLLQSVGDGIFGTDKEGRVIFANARAMELLGYGAEELIGHRVHQLIHHSRTDGSFYPVEECPMYHAYAHGTASTVDDEALWRKDGTPFPVEYSAAPMRRGDTVIGSVVAFRDVTERKEAERRLQDAYGVISDSINYAANIQRAVLTGDEVLKATMADHFVLWEPRDVVGGDIYFSHAWGDGVLVVLADCTGHGVPGAFMTLIASGALDRAMTEVVPSRVGDLIRRVHQIVQVTLSQQSTGGDSDDGLELGACYLVPGAPGLTFAGARFSLFLVRDGGVEEIKGTRQGIGYRGIPIDQDYAETRLPDVADAAVYLTTDGLLDQVGGARGRMFGKKRFKTLLLDNRDQPMAVQKVRMLEALEAYQGTQRRRDDLSVIGFRPT